MLRSLLAPDRTLSANRRLAAILALVAGATDTGGFLSLHLYTSHMSGNVSTLAQSLVFARTSLALAGVLAIGSFLFGGVLTSLLVRWARAHRLHSIYALPLLLEAALLLLFGLSGHLHHTLLRTTLAVLCFAMGLQNALITKISGDVIRTTHITGMLTDIGIELGRLLATPFATPTPDAPNFDAARLRLLATLTLLFLTGGLIGTVGFARLGPVFATPFALALFLLAALPVLDDLGRRPLPAR